MLRALKEIVNPTPLTAIFRVGSAQPILVSEPTWYRLGLNSPIHNIDSARRSGISPINFLILRTQFSERQIMESVLFDTPPREFTPGNHWRVLSVDNDKDTVSLQMCGPLGQYDIELPPFTVSQEDILFTGISTMNYVRNQGRMTLAEVVAAHKMHEKSEDPREPKDVRYFGSTIYWTTLSGKLVPYERHPLFASRKTA